MLELIYRHDTAFSEARKLLRSQFHPLAVLHNVSGRSEAEFLEAEKGHAQHVGVRSTAISTGSALMDFQHMSPLPTQELEIPLWETQIRMSPSGHIMTLTRDNFTEAKSSWASYHTGVAAGLSIKPGLATIDTSWIVLNKPGEPNNRHAGLLLGLGLNGYLRRMEKWLVFKYLTPKHDMTSTSLLLGLAASYLGTMNSLVVRVLSVHLVSLLPHGSAELNLSPLVQTAGIMGVGLLYHNSQHRRMSEVMLSEIEYVEEVDASSSPGRFTRDEGYRLAAGFALGLINLGHGNDLRALHDMGIERRLLSIVIGSRDTHSVTLVDQANAGAIIALALIYMKTNNASLAQKVDIPNTIPQFNYVRPDILLLHVVAKNLIMWDHIEPSEDWICRGLPRQMRDEMSIGVAAPAVKSAMALSGIVNPLSSSHVHLYNIVAGLCWSIGLKHAGSGNGTARDLILAYYDRMASFLGSPITFDARLVRSTLKRLQHLVLLSAATVMAGTGDLNVLRRARILHGTITCSSTFGLHQAAHMAIGLLFLGQGRVTLSTANLSIASLLCAFYPLFPREVMDNRAHLQAFRHFWVFATEPRCLLPRDVETNAPIITTVEVLLKDGSTRTVEAPALLLPSLEAIAKIRALSEEYWPVEWDFAGNPEHLAEFRKHQTIYLKRRSRVAQHGGNIYELALARELDSRRTDRGILTGKDSRLDNELVEKVFSLPVLREAGLSPAYLETVFPRPLPASGGGGEHGALTRRERAAARESRKRAKKQAAEARVAADSGPFATASAGHSHAQARFQNIVGGANGKEEPGGSDEDEEDEVDAGGLKDLPLESLLDWRTTAVDDVLSLWARASGLHGDDAGATEEELAVLFPDDDDSLGQKEEQGWFSDEILSNLKAEMWMKKAHCRPADVNAMQRRKSQGDDRHVHDKGSADEEMMDTD